MMGVLGLSVIGARALHIAHAYEQDIHGCDCDIHIISADFVS
jgi:phosphoglycerate dehydrogenase-like enzyme